MTRRTPPPLPTREDVEAAIRANVWTEDKHESGQSSGDTVLGIDDAADAVLRLLGGEG